VDKRNHHPKSCVVLVKERGEVVHQFGISKGGKKRLLYLGRKAGRGMRSRLPPAAERQPCLGGEMKGGVGRGEKGISLGTPWKKKNGANSPNSKGSKPSSLAAHVEDEEGKGGDR